LWIPPKKWIYEIVSADLCLRPFSNIFNKMLSVFLLFISIISYVLRNFNLFLLDVKESVNAYLPEKKNPHTVSF